MNPPSNNIFSANNSKFLVLGSLNLELRYMGRSSFVEIFIVNEPSKLLISLQACKDLAIVPQCFPLPIDNPHVRSVKARKVSKPSGQVDISQLGEIPEVPSDEDVSRLEGKFLELFSDVFCETELQPMNCDPYEICLLYTSPSPRDRIASRMPSSA